MATKNFVPRATGEGQLGTDSKKWDKHIAISGAYSYVSASSKGSFGSLYVGGNSELAGNYQDDLINKKVRDNKEVVINNKQLNDKLNEQLNEQINEQVNEQLNET